MKFSEMPYTRPDIDALRGKMDDIVRRMTEAENARTQIDAFEEYQALARDVQTNMTLAYVRHTIDTRDEFYDKENEYCDEVGPLLQEQIQRVGLALLGSKFRPDRIHWV